MIDRRQDSGEEPFGPVVQPDTVLPSQFFSFLRERGFVEGEKRLMAAVLSDAVDTYMKFAFGRETRQRTLFGEAETWLFGDSRSANGSFSFLEICDVLGLDPGYVRRGLGEWRSRRVPTMRVGEGLRRGPSAPGPRERRRRELKKAG